MPVTLVQQVFRFRTDATKAQAGTPVWAAAQNVNFNPPATTPFRIRFIVADTGNTSAASQIYNLFISRNGGAYAAITNVSTNAVYSADATAAASADNSAITTSLLTGGTGTFATVGQYDSSGATAAFILATGTYVELEFGIVLNANAAASDTYDFRVYQAGSVLNTYTVTPRIVVRVAATLSATQVGQTLVGAGGPRVGGTLAVTGASDTLAGVGTAALPVVLLVHCDGASGSTTFTDASSSAHALTATNVTVNTAASKFGTGDAYFTFGSGNANIDTGNASDFWFGSAPFTMEAWCFANSSPTGDGYNPILCEWTGTVDNLGFFFNVYPTIMFFWSTTGSNYFIIDSGIALPANAWHHVAIDRDASGVARLYLDGAVIASGACPDTFYPSPWTCLIGNDHGGTRAFPGALDEIRVVKGAAMYGGAFTPPTAPFLPADPVITSGALSVVQANETIVAAGGPRVGGTLNVNEIADTLAAAGTVAFVGVSGALAIIQAPNSLSGAGSVIPVAQPRSLYGKGVYGVGHYSRATAWDLGGNISLSVSFAGDFTVLMAGGLTVRIDLQGSLAVDMVLAGNAPVQVDLAASDFISGPLWAGTEPCPSLPWTPTEPCPPSMWTPVPPPTFVPPSGGWIEQEKVDDLPVWGDAKK